jgi:hypothetical protein
MRPIDMSTKTIPAIALIEVSLLYSSRIYTETSEKSLLPRTECGKEADRPVEKA